MVLKHLLGMHIQFYFCSSEKLENFHLNSLFPTGTRSSRLFLFSTVQKLVNCYYSTYLVRTSSVDGFGA